jgi:hypothetical protein
MSITYVKVGSEEILSQEECDSVMYLIKVLFRLEIIDEEQVLKIATQYHVLFV